MKWYLNTVLKVNAFFYNNQISKKGKWENVDSSPLKKKRECYDLIKKYEEKNRYIKHDKY